MSIDELPRYLYLVVMGIVAIGWLGLILFPRRPFVNFWFSGLIVPLILYSVYMFLLITFWFRPPTARLTQFTTLAGVAAMFENSGLLLVAWLNIITTDLVAGAWMARKAAQIRMPYLFLLPCLIVTFVFVGFGFSLFALFVAIGRGWSEIAKFESQPPTNTSPVAAQPSVLSSA